MLIPALHYSHHSLRAQLNVDIHSPNLLQAGAQGFGHVSVAGGEGEFHGEERELCSQPGIGCLYFRLLSEELQSKPTLSIFLLKSVLQHCFYFPA